MANNPAVALNRFGLGARPDEAPPADPAGWLKGQFARFEVRPAGIAALPDPTGVLVDFYAERRELKMTQANLQPGTTQPAMNDPGAVLKQGRGDIQALSSSGKRARLKRTRHAGAVCRAAGPFLG